MRILRIPDISIPTQAPVPAQGSAPVREGPSIEPLLEKIQALEDRLRTLEQSQKAEKPNGSAPLVKMSLADDQLHKPLLNKMWKYLHDERPPKTV